MKTVKFFGFVICFFVLLNSFAPAKNAVIKNSLFAPLESGTKVSVKEQQGKFVFTLMEGIPQSHVVIEVGTDYLVVEDQTGLIQTRIPVTSLQSVVVMKLKKAP